MELHLLHPKLVHFPIALIVTGAVLEILSWISKKDRWHSLAVSMYIIGTVTIGLAVLAGLKDAAYFKIHHPVLDEHKLFAFLALGSAVVSWLVLLLAKRKNEKIFRILFLIFILLVCIFVVLAAHEGGEMVYEYGVGVAL